MPQTSQFMLLVGVSVSGSSQGSGLVDTVGLPMGLPFPSVPSVLPLTSIEVPELSPMVGYKYLHLSQSTAGRTSQRTAKPSGVGGAYPADQLQSHTQKVQGVSNPG